ncbi:hypothetical protein [Sphingomicrobium lutaoense]|uniref:Uncharacterized protein n=1 Tax=Sphingomicrobium lutaoense TaxID=515949 RepID=A0A839YZ26_9SPHN|nr:hypothetical protein [Sphingomicrobium lutaoense]MBB3764389.1 hypothetical protein [Sphingomicrobium lutaoense]
MSKQTSGVGAVTITVDDQRQVSYDPEDVTPDENNNIEMTLQSSGTKQWSFMQNNPVTIANPQDFTSRLIDDTHLNVNDTGADKARNPTHQYTVHVVSNTGEHCDFDPIIRDRGN